MAFPSSLDSFTGFTSTHTLQADNHAAQSNQEQTAIVAVETKLGTGSSTPTNNTVLRGNGTGTTTYDTVHLATDVSGQLSASNAQPVLQAVYPVGCIYTETTGVNPATTFGFGTWVAFGQGQVLVGNGTSDQAFAAGSTGGESNHILTSTETTSHRHNWQFALYDYQFSPNGPDAGMNVGPGADAAGAYRYSTSTYQGASSDGHTFASTAQNPTTASVTITRYPSTGDTDTQTHVANGAAHNNLQPYIVVYFWKRTV